MLRFTELERRCFDLQAGGMSLRQIATQTGSDKRNVRRAIAAAHNKLLAVNSAYPSQRGMFAATIEPAIFDQLPVSVCCD